jgi:DNA-binding transcriptional MerR regulator
MTIDQLAAAAGVPTRTLRFYQSKGLLPRPLLRGRVAYYGPPHLEALRTVAGLQDRGLQIKAISDLMERLRQGELTAAEWLGLEDQLRAPWAGDRPRLLSADELGELLGAGAARPGLLGELLRVRLPGPLPGPLIERQGDAYLVSSPALLALAVRLEALGIDLDAVAASARLLRKRMARTAADLVHTFLERTRRPHRRSEAAIASGLNQLRPLALDAVRLIFAQEMERELRQLVDSGRAARITRR